MAAATAGHSYSILGGWPPESAKRIRWPALEDAEPFEIHGAVTTVRTGPVAGAEVEINLRAVDVKPLPPQTVETDLRGEFNVKVPAHSSHPGGGHFCRQQEGFLDARDSIEVTLERPRAGLNWFCKSLWRILNCCLSMSSLPPSRPNYACPQTELDYRRLRRSTYALALRSLAGTTRQAPSPFWPTSPAAIRAAASARP